MTETPFNNDNILSNFPLCLRQNIEELCLNSKIGLCSVSLKDITYVPYRTPDSDENPLDNYHFIIKIPYAGRRLSWDIIFNHEDLFFAPDFDFNDEGFLANPSLDVYKRVPSLVNWNIKNPSALTSVLKEFLALYKENQIKKLENENVYSYSKQEFDLLKNKASIKEEKIEVLLENNSVHFLISIDVDCSQLPDYIQPSDNQKFGMLLNPGQDYVHVRVSFGKLDNSVENTTIHLSPRFTQILENLQPLCIPEYNKDDSLAEYVLTITNYFGKKITMIAEHCELKKQFVLYLAAVFATSLVEYDSDNFTTCTFSYEVEDYVCLVEVDIGPKFPFEKPQITLHSLYCQKTAKCSATSNDYMYLSNMKVDEMVNCLIESLAETIGMFKEHED